MVEYLKVKDAAERARCSKRSIQRAIKAGRLRSFRPPGIRLRLISASDLEIWLSAPAQRGRGRPRLGTRAQLSLAT